MAPVLCDTIKLSLILGHKDPKSLQISDPIPTTGKKNNIAFAIQTLQRTDQVPSTSHARHREVTVPPKVVGRPQKRSLNQLPKRKRNSYETASESESDDDEKLFATPEKLRPLLPSPKLKPRKLPYH